ncbi:MAG: FeoB-associated Cys-rich membrane protein [Bacteroidales bacterium]|nr:FeoB-associated Cys-rich membrane protein [Bacteroidales bacterium]
MNISDIIIIAVIATAVVLALRHNISRGKKGGCCSSCSSCTHDCALHEKHDAHK